MIFSAAIFTIGQIYWITPGEKAYKNLLHQIPAIEARAGQVLSRMPDLAGLKQLFRREETRLRPLQEETAKSEKQLLTKKSTVLLAEQVGAKLEKIAETPQLVVYSKAFYTLTQRGDYSALMASLNHFEAASSFLKFSSLTLEKSEDQVLLQTDFSVLTSPANQSSVA